MRDVRLHALEAIDAAELSEGLRGRRVHRYAVLVEPALDEPGGACGSQPDGVGIEQHGGDTCLEVRDDVEDLGVEQGLPDAVQHDAIKGWELFGDHPDAIERQVGRRLQCLERSDARLAFRIAPVGCFQVQRARQGTHDRRPRWLSHGQSPETTVVQALPTFGRS